MFQHFCHTTCFHVVSSNYDVVFVLLYFSSILKTLIVADLMLLFEVADIPKPFSCLLTFDIFHGPISPTRFPNVSQKGTREAERPKQKTKLLWLQFMLADR